MNLCSSLFEDAYRTIALIIGAEFHWRDDAGAMKHAHVGSNAVSPGGDAIMRRFPVASKLFGLAIVTCALPLAHTHSPRRNRRSPFVSSCLTLLAAVHPWWGGLSATS